MSTSDYDDELSIGDCEREENEKLAMDTLRDDLTRVLRYGFNFKGKSAFSMPLSYSPNPCLHIDGIGIVGLPLSDRDANLIVSASSSASKGTDLQDTIRIDNSKVSYKNPKWEPYVDDVFRERVWKKLGCAPSKAAPHYEFRGLFLQKPGSRFLSFEDAETPQVGTFSTVIIVLPSEFTGGEIRASHGDRSFTLAPAEGSLYGTTLLAWYTNVTYRAENLTSGFRLALVYNLIHTSAKIPVPCVPSDDTLIAHTREVFHKWVSSGYEGLPDNHVAAYVLHDGDNVKGDDALSMLKTAADAENMTLLLGTLCAHVTGWAETSTNENPPYGLSQGTFENPIMERLDMAKFKVEKLTDIRGEPTFNEPRLVLDEENLVPELPFRDIEPDEHDARASARHDDAPLEYWYERPALVFFPGSKQLDVLLTSGGVEYALTELKQSTSEGQTKENQKIVEFIFQNWHKTPLEADTFIFCPSYEVPTMTPQQTATGLANIAVQSNDAELWVRTMGMCKFRDEADLSRFGLEHILAGWERFRLAEIEVALDRIVNGLRNVRGTLMALKAFQNSKKVLHPEPRRDEWLSIHLDRSFAKKADEDALDSIMEVACSKGLDYISRVIMPPLLTQPLGVPGWAQVVEYLYHSQDQLVALPPLHGRTLSNEELFESILDDVRSKITKGDPMLFLTDSEDDDSDENSVNSF